MKYLPHFLSRPQKLGDAQSVGFVLLHSDRKSPHPTEHEPRIEWCENPAIQHVGTTKDLSRTLGCSDQGACYDIAVSPEVLGGGVDHDVDAMCDWLLKKR